MILIRSFKKRNVRTLSMQFQLVLVFCSLGHAALAVADLLQAGADPGEEDEYVGFESILSQFLSVCKCQPGEEDVSGDVDGVLGGLVVVVGLVIGPDAVGRDVPLEHHCSDLRRI